MKKFICLLIAALMMFAGSAQAADADSGLYDPLPPEGSAFVRFLNATAEKAEISANGKTYPALEPRSFSPYYVIQQGKVNPALGKLTNEFEAQAGKFYTLAGTEALNIFEDGATDNRAKAQILFYNLSGNELLQLKTSDGKVEIAAAATKTVSPVREINPVKIETAVFAGERKIKDVDPVSLERALVYNVVILPDDSIIWARSTTDTTR